MPNVLPFEPDEETALLLAVREKIRDLLGAEREVNIEYDELPPSTIGAFYVAVIPGGITVLQESTSSGGVGYFTYGVKVCLIMRIADVPKERIREKFVWGASSLNKRLRAIIGALDLSAPWPAVMNRANELINWDSRQGFIEPLRLQSIDKTPQVAGAEFFQATNGENVGLKRSIVLGGAKRAIVRG